MAETGSISENPKIPESWSFAKALEPFKTEQIDVEGGFISVSRKFNPNDDADYMDYLIDREGSVLSTKDIVGQNVNACVRGADVDFVVNNNWGKGLRLTFKQREQLPGDEYDFLSEMTYAKTGELQTITLGSRFAVERDGGPKHLTLAPSIRLEKEHADKGGSDIWTPTFVFIESIDFRVLRKTDEEKSIFFVDKSGVVTYRANWKEQDGKLIMNQEHIESGVVKTLIVPLQIDMKEVNAVLFSKPPYPKEKIARVEGLERIKVPWVEIQQIIGVRNEYSAPSKTKTPA